MIDPRTTAVTGRHLPALNGLRALAVLGVMAYHLQLGWASGGYLGVDLFFVLSGFLITTLLLEEWAANGTVNLADFWARRARRLLPALFLVVAALALYLIANAVFGGPGANGLIDLSALRGDAIATLLYVGNWHAIYAHQSYFAQFSTPSPLQHTWSLAIEEQFYLVWPLVLLFLLRVGRRSWRQFGLVFTVALGVASAVLMAVLFHPGGDPTRIYYGTDTRLFDLMAGATLAFLAASRTQPNERAQRTLHVASPIAAAGLAVCWVTGGTPSGLPRNWMFDGGFLLCALLAAVVVADARLTAPGLFSRLLASPPLHFLGTISYGIYLWHWPVFVYLNAARTGLSTVPLDLARIGATLVVSTASYYLVERPLRHANLRGRLRLWAAPLAGLSTAVFVVVATVPAVADPGTVATTARSSAHSTTQLVAGTGGYGGQTPITLSPPPSPSHPLHVMVLGDSVMHDASYGITAALQATGVATVYTKTIDGFGLVRASNWPTSLPNLIHQTRAQLIVASWSWDQDGPTTPNALHQPVQYTALLRRAVQTMLEQPGVNGIVFTQFPLSGEIPAANPANQKAYDAARVAGVVAWNKIAAAMARDFPGRVMYLPLADSVLLHGTFSPWLPPIGQPSAPKSQWIRVRKIDNVHLCPEGSALYASALLTDMTKIFGLPAPASNAWTQGAWTSDPNFNDPPGACPDDHPPNG